MLSQAILCSELLTKSLQRKLELEEVKKDYFC